MGQQRPSDFIDLCASLGRGTLYTALWFTYKSAGTIVNFSKLVTKGVKEKLDQEADKECDCNNCPLKKTTD